MILNKMLQEDNIQGAMNFFETASAILGDEQAERCAVAGGNTMNAIMDLVYSMHCSGCFTNEHHINIRLDVA